MYRQAGGIQAGQPARMGRIGQTGLHMDPAAAPKTNVTTMIYDDQPMRQH